MIGNDVQKEVIRLWGETPQLTGIEIGKKLGITRQYVSLIVRNAGLSRHDYSFRKVLRPECERVSCVSRLARNNQRFCSMECRKSETFSIVTCHWCGRKKEVLASSIIRRSNDSRYTGKWFCNNVCQGEWLGKNYGRGVQKAKDVDSN